MNPYEIPQYIIRDDVCVDAVVRYFSMESCPLKAKVQVLTHGGVATHAMIVSEEGKNDFIGWRPCPRKPEGETDV